MSVKFGWPPSATLSRERCENTQTELGVLGVSAPTAGICSFDVWCVGMMDLTSTAWTKLRNIQQKSLAHGGHLELWHAQSPVAWLKDVWTWMKNRALRAFCSAFLGLKPEFMAPGVLHTKWFSGMLPVHSWCCQLWATSCTSERPLHTYINQTRFTFCTLHWLCGIWCHCCSWRCAPAALWQRFPIFGINMSMARMKLQAFFESVLAFQQLIFHPLNANEGSDITMVAPVILPTFQYASSQQPIRWPDNCHRVPALCKNRARTCAGRSWPERWFRTDASKHHFPPGHCVEPFFSFWWFSQTFGEEKGGEPNFYKTLSSLLGFDYELLHPRVEPQKFGTCLHGRSGAKRIQQFSWNETKWCVIGCGPCKCCVGFDSFICSCMNGVLFPALLHDRQIISSSLAITSLYMYAVVM